MPTFPDSERVMMTPDQVGWIIGWAGGNKSTAHVTAALLSNQFGIQVTCRIKRDILWITLFGESAHEADSVMKFASAIRNENELLFRQIMINLIRFRHSGILTDPD